MKLSIIMGVYNDSKNLKKSIESILNQSFKAFEFIICNDASTDGSKEIIEKYQNQDARIVYIENEKNMGLAYSLNRCIEISKTDIIVRMDSDDIAIANRLEVQYEFFTKHDYAIVGSSIYKFDENGIYAERQLIEKPSKSDIYIGNSFVHPTVMMDKKILNEVGNYTVANYTKRTEDFDLWCKIYQKGYSGFNLSDKLLNYRESRESIQKRKFKFRVHAFKLKLYWRKKLGLPFYYNVYAFKHLILGLLPKSIYFWVKRR